MDHYRTSTKRLLVHIVYLVSPPRKILPNRQKTITPLAEPGVHVKKSGDSLGGFRSTYFGVLWAPSILSSADRYPLRTTTTTTTLSLTTTTSSIPRLALFFFSLPPFSTPSIPSSIPLPLSLTSPTFVHPNCLPSLHELIPSCLFPFPSIPPYPPSHILLPATQPHPQLKRLPIHDQTIPFILSRLSLSRSRFRDHGGHGGAGDPQQGRQ